MSAEGATVPLAVEYPDAPGFIADYHRNVCHGKTFVISDRLLPIGTRVRLLLSFPGLREAVQLPGIVRAIGSMGPGAPGMHVQFESIDLPARERLADLVTKIERGDPSVIVRIRRILIVEDNPHVASLLQDGIGGTAARDRDLSVRFEFLTAKDGLEAKALISSQPIDLVITDVFMPVMDGVQLLRLLRSDARFSQLPVIVVSAGGPGAKDRALEAGANVFIEKPLRLQALLAAVRANLPG